MKTIKAFLIALVLFALSALGIHCVLSNSIPSYNIRNGTWIADEKFGCHEALEALLSNDESLPIFGSSELRRGQKSGFHANTIFKNSDMEPVFIGKAGYQCLIHAITMGSLGDELHGKKVVLVVSPQWYKDTGIKTSAFQTAFSEDNLIYFLQNPNISDETKQYVMKRAKKLTENNEIFSKKIQNDVDWFTSEQVTDIEDVERTIHREIVQEKSKSRFLSMLILNRVPIHNLAKKDKTIKDTRWQKLTQKAEKKGEKLCRYNSLGMLDSSYIGIYKKALEQGKVKKCTLTKDSIEFEDLKCFLEVCKEEEIQPLVVMLPFNGYWYDQIGFDSSMREPLYNKTEKIVSKYDAEYLDLSGDEYEKYYFEDNSHPGMKGLVKLNEEIYKFYREGER